MSSAYASSCLVCMAAVVGRAFRRPRGHSTPSCRQPCLQPRVLSPPFSIPSHVGAAVISMCQTHVSYMCHTCVIHTQPATDKILCVVASVRTQGVLACAGAASLPRGYPSAVVAGSSSDVARCSHSKESTACGQTLECRGACSCLTPPCILECAH